MKYKIYTIRIPGGWLFLDNDQKFIHFSKGYKSVIVKTAKCYGAEEVKVKLSEEQLIDLEILYDDIDKYPQYPQDCLTQIKNMIP